jgi:hypothetical protein
LLTCVIIGKSFVRAYSPAVVLSVHTSPAKKEKINKKFTFKFSYVAYLFCNPTHETETLGQQIGHELLIENHLDESL